jgi:hypothetical protein
MSTKVTPNNNVVASERSERATSTKNMCVCCYQFTKYYSYIFLSIFHEDYFLGKPSIISDILTVLPYTILYYTKIINYVCIIINYRDIEIERDRKRR